MSNVWYLVKITRHVRKQNNVTYDRGQIKSIVRDTEMKRDDVIRRIRLNIVYVNYAQWAKEKHEHK